VKRRFRRRRGAAACAEPNPFGIPRSRH
jgi:hypothetical protein